MGKRTRLFLFFAVVVLFAASGRAQADQTDDYIRAQLAQQHIPGLSLVVLRDGKIVKAEGYGLANMKRGIPATPATVYKIASVSKQFIATGIMLLVQDRKLGLDDPISIFLDGSLPAWSRITIRHLLTHTSGLARESPGFRPYSMDSDADVIRAAYPVPLRFAPGDKWEYSNLGYSILAEIIHRVSGRSWSDYLADKVFTPSGMSATRTTTTTEKVPNRAVGYTDHDHLQEAPDWPAVRPSGAFLSTVLDLAKWDAVLYTDRILSDSIRREMWTAVTLNDGSSYPYGFGWELDSLRGHAQVHHGGSIPGFLSQFARFVDDHLTIIVLINLDDADAGSIARGIAPFYFAAAVPVPAPAEKR